MMITDMFGKTRHFLTLLVLISVLCFGLLILLFPSRNLFADTLQNRSVRLNTNQPSQTARHSYSFIVPTISTIGSIVFEYCSNSPVFNLPCTAPGGLDVTGAVLSSQTGNTGFSIDNADTTANKIVIDRIPSAGSAIITSTYDFDNITNPSSGGEVVYVRVATYASTDGSGSYNDNGAVAFVTSYIFNVSANVPPFMKLCVAVSVALDCSSASGSSINLGLLLPTSVAAATSQFAIGANSDTGYSIYSLGTTMTSGNNAISAINSQQPSFIGTDQFGINLRANSVIGVGSDPQGPGAGAPTANYNSPNFYMFGNGDIVATSPHSTDYNRMTVTYIVNVNGSQSPGIYSTTITYLALAQF